MYDEMKIVYIIDGVEVSEKPTDEMVLETNIDTGIL